MEARTIPFSIVNWMFLRARTILLLITVACAVAGCGGRGRANARPIAVATTTTNQAERQNGATSFEPSVLPGPVLIADRGNNRLLVVNPITIQSP